jgi:hypothetical protein
MQTNVELTIPGTHVRLGDRARDPISGFEGIVTTWSRHLTGCNTIWLTGLRGDDGNHRECCVDVLRIELLESNPLKATPIPSDVPPAG